LVSFPPRAAQLEVWIEVVVALVVGVSRMPGNRGRLLLMRGANMVAAIRITLRESRCGDDGAKGDKDKKPFHGRSPGSRAQYRYERMA
jgi:hypothetical protein